MQQASIANAFKFNDASVRLNIMGAARIQECGAVFFVRGCSKLHGSVLSHHPPKVEIPGTGRLQRISCLLRKLVGLKCNEKIASLAFCIVEANPYQICFCQSNQKT
jgi:hypothetical protein